MTARKVKPTPKVGVGMPFYARLNSWGAELYRAFGETPYLVGSSAVSKTWRDVDVRVILDEEPFVRLCGERQRPNETNPRWAALVTAISLWGRECTGLPIDFQFQLRDAVLQDDWDKCRVPLGIFVRGEDVLN